MLGYNEGLLLGDESRVEWVDGFRSKSVVKRSSGSETQCGGAD